MRRWPTRRFPGGAPHRQNDLLAAHRPLLEGLIPSAVRWRSGEIGGVDIPKGGEIARLPPPADRVDGLMKDLPKFARDESVPMLVHWAAVHYEMEGSTDPMTATVEPVGYDTPFCFCTKSGGKC